MKPTCKLAAISCSLAIVYFTSACSAHLVSTRLSTLPAGDTVEPNGVLYTLPRTVVKVTIPVIVTEVTAGSLAAYAPLFFPDDSVLPAGKALSFKVASLETFGEPDPDLVFHLNANGTRDLKQALSFEFTEEGTVTGIKAEVESQTAELVLAGIAAVARTVTGVLNPLSLQGVTLSPDSRKKFMELVTPDDPFLSTFLDPNKRPEVILTFGKLADSVKRRLIKEYEENEPKLYRARETYDLLVRLIDGQNALLAKPKSSAPGALDVLDRATAKIKVLREEFLGRESAKSWMGVFHVRPERATAICSRPDDRDRKTPCNAWTSEPLLSYVRAAGICRIDTSSVANPPEEAFWASPTSVPCAHKTERREVILRLSIQAQDVAARVADHYIAPDEAGLHFLIPARMDTRVTVIGDPMWTESRSLLMISQLGLLAAMPSDMDGKAVTHDVKYFAASGALKSYVLTSKPMITPEMINALSASTSSVLDARRAQLKEASAQSDELNQLLRQKGILEALFAIQKACADLTNPPPTCGK